MTGCVFCKIIAGEIPCHKIWEDEDYFAFLDLHPINPGHTILVPKLHVDYLFDLEENTYGELFARARLLAGPLRSALHAKRIGIAVEGFGVPHVHVHLVPVNAGNELNPERAQEVAPEVLANVKAKILRDLQDA